MPAVDASGNRIARTLDGGPPQRAVYIPSPVPSPEPTPRSPEPTPLPTERRLPRQVSRRKIAPLSPPTSPTKAERSRGRIHHDRKRASFDAYEPSHVKPAAVALKDWAPTTAVVRRPAEQTPKWDAYHQNSFPPKPDEEEGTVHVRPLFRSHRVAIQRRAAQVGCVGMAHNDPLYLPAHTAAAIDAPTLQKLRKAGSELKRGICERRHVTTLMECAFDNKIVSSAKARYCREDLGCTSMKHCTYPKVCEWIARERIKQLRTSKPVWKSTSV